MYECVCDDFERPDLIQYRFVLMGRRDAVLLADTDSVILEVRRKKGPKSGPTKFKRTDRLI